MYIFLCIFSYLVFFLKKGDEILLLQVREFDTPYLGTFYYIDTVVIYSMGDSIEFFVTDQNFTDVSFGLLF